MKRVAGPRKDPSLNHSEQTTSSGVCHSTRFEPALHGFTLLDCARPGSTPCLAATENRLCFQSVPVQRDLAIELLRSSSPFAASALTFRGLGTACSPCPREGSDRSGA